VRPNKSANVQCDDCINGSISEETVSSHRAGCKGHEERVAQLLLDFALEGCALNSIPGGNHMTHKNAIKVGASKQGDKTPNSGG
jgi:hypothetical protein